MPDLVLGAALTPPHYSAAIITNRQVLEAGSHKGQASAQSMRLNDIFSISQQDHSGSLGKDYRVFVSGPGEARLSFGFQSLASSNKFTERLQRARDNVASGASSATYSDVSDRLRKLTKLFEDGLISEPEFLQKRQQLLDNL
jgi:hypothetical protein